ncbi:GntR family transcriptional regulator [Paracoccus sp. Z330]|uniref:GntR family transcriptional regulator n=1 Tax=Paracoccus onchidii TaxID=3017813 RepID=A0ABT4ZE05_9RHOB|nr:GntR family transcriptional regulator [Paracoccus onchidii]MDB6176971.1 GntR family transcriptional regulator [Paracoccus onchidii]
MTDRPIPQLPRPEAMTTQEYAYLRLRDAIMVGVLRPGTALTFRGLAQQMDLSPTPIREAIRRLSSENAIEVLGNRRLRIPDMSAGRLEDLVELRVMLERHAILRAMPYLSEIAIDDLRRLDDNMDHAIAARDLDALTRLNHRFHRDLYCLPPHHGAMALIESVWLQLGPFQRRVVEQIETIIEVDHHKAILKALADRDPVALCAALESDIRDGILHLGRQILGQDD